MPLYFIVTLLFSHDKILFDEGTARIFLHQNRLIRSTSNLLPLSTFYFPIDYIKIFNRKVKVFENYFFEIHLTRTMQILFNQILNSMNYRIKRGCPLTMATSCVMACTFYPFFSNRPKTRCAPSFALTCRIHPRRPRFPQSPFSHPPSS